MTPHNGNSDNGSIDPSTPYVRRKAKIQVGDGPDQRGEITVELVARTDDGDGDGDLDASFADWHNEVNRSTRVLKDQLGLPDAGGDDK